MAAHKGESFDQCRVEKIVTPSASVRHSFGDVDKFFTINTSIAEFSNNSTDFPSISTLTIDHHKIKMKKRLRQQQMWDDVDIAKIENIEMKIMQNKQALTREKFEELRHELQFQIEQPGVKNSAKAIMRIWTAMRTLTDTLLVNVQTNSPSKAPKARIQKKEVGTITDKMDVNMLSASDEFFIEFELNKKYHKSIADLDAMKTHLESLQESTSSDAARTLTNLSQKLTMEVKHYEETTKYEPEQFDNINVKGWQTDMMTRIKEMQVRTANSVMKSFKVGIEDQECQTDFVFYSAEDWKVQQVVISELNNEIEALIDEKKKLQKERNIMLNDKDNLLKEITTLESQKVEAETLLDKANEQKKIYRLKSEKQRNKKEALRTCRENDSILMEKYKNRIESLQAKIQRLLADLDFKDQELEDAIGKLCSAQGMVRQSESVKKENDKAPAKQTVVARQRREPNYDNLGKRPNRHQYSDSDDEPVEKYDSPRQGNQSQLSSQPRSSQPRSVVPSTTPNRSQNVSQLAASNQKTPSVNRSPSPQVENTPTPPPAVVEVAQSVEIKKQIPSPRNVIKEVPEKKPQQTKQQPAAAAKPAAKPAAKQAEPKPKATETRSGTTSETNAPPAKKAPAANKAPATNTAAAKRKPRQAPTIEAVPSDEEEQTFEEEEQQTPTASKAQTKSKSKLSPRNVQKGKLIPSPRAANQRSKAKLLPPQPKVKEGSTDAMRFSPLPDAEDEHEEEEDAANPEERVLGERPRVDTEEQGRRSPSKTRMTKNYSPVKRSEQAKISNRKPDWKSPRNSPIKSIEITDHSGKSSRTAIDSLQASLQDIHFDVKMPTVSTRVDVTNDVTSILTGETEKGRPVVRMYTLPDRKKFQMEDKCIDTFDLIVRKSINNSMPTQTGDDLYIDCQVSGLSDCEEAPEQMDYQREKKSERYLFKCNPTSMLGLRGDVFYQSSAQAFVAAPKLPELSQTSSVNVKTDLFASSPGKKCGPSCPPNCVHVTRTNLTREPSHLTKASVELHQKIQELKF